MKTKTEDRMEKALYKISQKMYFDFSDNFGYAFQGSPLTMFIYDFFDDIEAESTAFSRGLGGKKWVKYFGLDVFGNAFTRVGNPDDNGALILFCRYG